MPVYRINYHGPGNSMHDPSVSWSEDQEFADDDAMRQALAGQHYIYSVTLKPVEIDWRLPAPPSPPRISALICPNCGGGEILSGPAKRGKHLRVQECQACKIRWEVMVDAI